MTKFVYRLDGVLKKYGEREVCKVDQWDVPRAAISVVMGPNGAGKSTLLKILGFLEPITAGSVIFDKHQYSSGNEPPLDIRRRVTMVFQSPSFLRTTVEKNVAYGLEVRGEQNIGHRVDEILERVGLAHMAKEKTSTLSGGEAQRVALARALVFQPDVLLLDEPTANLDPANVSLVEQLIRDSVTSNGTTVVLVTQNVFQAKRLADSATLLMDGKMIEASPGKKLFTDPEDPRTIAFVTGDMPH